MPAALGIGLVGTTADFVSWRQPNPLSYRVWIRENLRNQAPIGEVRLERKKLSLASPLATLVHRFARPSPRFPARVLVPDRGEGGPIEAPHIRIMTLDLTDEESRTLAGSPSARDRIRPLSNGMGLGRQVSNRPRAMPRPPPSHHIDSGTARRARASSCERTRRAIVSR